MAEALAGFYVRQDPLMANSLTKCGGYFLWSSLAAALLDGSWPRGVDVL